MIISLLETLNGIEFWSQHTCGGPTFCTPPRSTIKIIQNLHQKKQITSFLLCTCGHKLNNLHALINNCISILPSVKNWLQKYFNLCACFTPKLYWPRKYFDINSILTSAVFDLSTRGHIPGACPSNLASRHHQHCWVSHCVTATLIRRNKFCKKDKQSNKIKFKANYFTSSGLTILQLITKADWKHIDMFTFHKRA